MLSKRGTGQRLAMFGERRRWPGGESIDNCMTAGVTNSDGGQHSRRGATEDTTTNHQQAEHRRHGDIGGGCSDGDSVGKGEGVVATVATEVAVVVATTTVAMTTTVTTVVRARMVAMAAAFAMAMAAALMVATAMATADAMAVLSWLSSLLEKAVGQSQQRQWWQRRPCSDCGQSPSTMTT